MRWVVESSRHLTLSESLVARIPPCFLLHFCAEICSKHAFVSCTRDSAPLLLQTGSAATEKKNNFDWQSSSASKKERGTQWKVANISRNKKSRTCGCELGEIKKQRWLLSKRVSYLVCEIFETHCCMTSRSPTLLTDGHFFLTNPQMMSSSPTAFPLPHWYYFSKATPPPKNHTRTSVHNKVLESSRMNKKHYFHIRDKSNVSQQTRSVFIIFLSNTPYEAETYRMWLIWTFKRPVWGIYIRFLVGQKRWQGFICVKYIYFLPLQWDFHRFARSTYRYPLAELAC